MVVSEEIRAGVAAIVAKVSTWDGVVAQPHRFGGTEFRLGRGEIGHVHEGGLVDVPFPRAVRDELIAEGVAKPHHRLPESGWVSYWLQSADDVPGALALLRRSYELRREHAAKAGGSVESAQVNEDALDEAIEESFPASDPPAVGHEE